MNIAALEPYAAAVGGAAAPSSSLPGAPAAPVTAPNVGSAAGSASPISAAATALLADFRTKYTDPVTGVFDKAAYDLDPYILTITPDAQMTPAQIRAIVPVLIAQRDKDAHMIDPLSPQPADATVQGWVAAYDDRIGSLMARLG